MKIMILGGAGFLGSKLVEELSKSRDTKILVFDSFTNGFPAKPLRKKNVLPPIVGNVRNYYDILRAMERFLPDVVFHLVAPTSRPETFGNFRECAETNYVGSANVAQAYMSIGDYPRKLIFASTLAAAEPQSHHGISKKATEDLLESIFSRFPELGVKVVVLRFSEIYGDSPSFTSSSLVNFIASNMVEGNNISLFSVDEELDNLHIADAVSACKLSLKSDLQFLRLDIGTGVGIKIREVVEKLKLLTKYKGQLCYLENDKVPIKSLIADTSPASDLLGFTSKSNFDAQLKSLVNKRKRKSK